MLRWQARDARSATNQVHAYLEELRAPAEVDGVPVLIRGDVSKAAIASTGAVPGTRAGFVTTAIAPLDALPALLALDGVVQIEASRQLHPQLDVSAPEIEATDVWGGTPPFYNGFTGTNVVIGVVDTGIDIDHADFRTSNNKTRLKYLWDQNTGGMNRPPEFNYGVEWTESEINAGQAAVQEDENGHGTHMTGVAAGNGRGTGNGQPQYEYVGIAPEADLIVVNVSPSESFIIDAVEYVFLRAASLGKDAVVLMALNNHLGGHDGTSNLDESLSALTGPGKLIAAAAGNFGNLDIHASANLSTNQTASIYFQVPNYTPSMGVFEFVELENWHSSGAEFRARLTSPGGHTTGWVYSGNTSGSVTTPDGTIGVENATVTNSKGAKRIRVFAFDVGDGNDVASGSWRLEVRRESGTQSGRIDSYVSDWRLNSGNQSPVFTSYVDPFGAVSSPATGDDIISAGAYTTKKNWVNVSGTPSFYVSNPTMWDIADFSSFGPRRDGVQRPDVAAPGYGVVAALSPDVLGGTSNVWIVEDGVHRIREGTSVAAAHVAGALALFLEEDPNLTPSAARAKLISKTRADQFTGAVPNGGWGHGKLDLMLVSTGIGDGPARFSMSPVFPNPTQGDARFRFTLSPQDADAAGNGVRVRIFDVRGREVGMVQGSRIAGPQEIIWDGRTRTGVMAAPGVYIGRLEVGDQYEVKRFVRLP